MKRIAALSVLLVFAQPAWGGSKYLANLVPVAASAPTLSAKSKVALLHNGLLKVSLRGITSPTGGPPVTDKSLKTGVITGDEYAVIVFGRIVAIDLDFELNVLIEPKQGKGKAKLELHDLFALLPGSAVRSIGIERVEVYGPIGATSVEGCANNLGAAAGISLPPAPNPCRGGARIGRSGIVVP